MTPSSIPPTQRTSSGPGPLVGFTALALLLAGCGKPGLAPLPVDAIAEVGTRIISTQEFADEAKRRGITAQSEDDAARRRRELLSHLIDEETIVQRALASGLDRDPDIQRRIRRMIAQEFRERALAPSTNSTPTSEELRHWYQAHITEFTEPSRVRGNLVSIRLPRQATDASREIARTRLEEARKQIESASNPGEAFATIVRTHSDDPSTRRQDGDTGWLVEGRLTRWPDEVVSAMFSLPPSDGLCRVVTTPEACFLIRVKEREASKIRPLEEVLPKVTHRFLAEAKERKDREFLSESRRHVSVRENPDALARVTFPIVPSNIAQTPPTLPGSQRRLPDLQP